MNLFNLLTDSTLCDGVLIPNQLFNAVATIIKVIKIAVPILLIIWGMLDFAKSVIAKNEDDVKKYRKSFISRVISAIIVFLIVFVVQLTVNLISSVEDTTNDSGQTVSDIWSCSKKFINGVDSTNTTEIDS